MQEMQETQIPGPGRSPGEENGNPLQYSCLGNPMDRGAWRATVHGVIKSWTQLSMHAKYQWSKWGQTQGLLPPVTLLVCIQRREFAQTHKHLHKCIGLRRQLPPLLARSSPGKVSLAQNVCDKGIRHVEGLPAYTSVLALNPAGLSKLNTELVLLSSLGIGPH